VGGDRGSGPEIAVDLEWVLSKDRQERLGVPVQIVSACRSSIIEAGRAYGMTWADAASAVACASGRTGPSPLRSKHA
jgi:hypothetical protein